MEIAITALGVLITVLAVWFTWWKPESTHIREQLGKNKPDIQFTAGYVGGPGGMGVGLQIFNKGDGRACSLTLEIQGIGSDSQRLRDLDPGGELIEQILFAPDSPVKEQPMHGLQVRLTYYDRFGRKFVAWRDLEPFQGADGVYRLKEKPDQKLQVEFPPQRFIDLWRLRKQF